MKTTILVAEDHPELTELYQAYLQRRGYRVLTASGGIECARVVRDESPDVILASAEMLWGGAAGLVDYLQQEYRFEWTPSVILTGCMSDEDTSELQEHPCVFCYLRKPFAMRTLMDRLEQIESAEEVEPLLMTSTPHLWP